MKQQSVQQRYAPASRCFGCGPANEEGLRIESFEEGEELVAHFVTEAHHSAFPGMVNGGILGALLDCHANWAAAMALKRERKMEAPPCTVTAEFTVRMKRPTPLGEELTLRARATEIADPKVWVEGEVFAGDTITATVSGLFVAVTEGHPAFGTW